MSIIVGIDTGVVTGLAVWDTEKQKLIRLESVPIHKALYSINWITTTGITLGWGPVALVRVEDARLRKWVTGGRERLQGAGSVKRDAKIWEDFLTDCEIPFEMVAPRHNVTKMDSKTFAKQTGWTKSTNQHERDAAGLVVGFTERNLQNTLQHT